MRLTKTLFRLALGMLFLFISVSASAAERHPLVEFLIKKGIITKKEAGNLAKEIKKYEAQKPAKGGFLSAKGAEFEIGGELELEFVNTGHDGSDDKAHFQLDKLVLQPKLKISDNLKLDAQLYFLESGATLNEIHAKFSNLFWGTWVDVGLYERWVKSQYQRKLEAYPLIGTAFWRDDAVTLTWGGEIKPLYWMLSVGNGYELDDKQVSEDAGRTFASGTTGNYILHDDHATSGLSDSMEYGINLGLEQKLGKGKIDILGFYYIDELSDADITFLQSQFPGYTSTTVEKNRRGLSVRYGLGGWRLAGQYIMAKDGLLGRNGWVAETGYHFKFKDREWFSGVMPVISYGVLNIASPYHQNPNNPLSWDRQKTMGGLIVDLSKNTKLKLEYYSNHEVAGGNDVANDEFLTQLEFKF